MLEKLRKFQRNSFFNYIRSINVGNALMAKTAPKEVWVLIASTIITAFVLQSMNTTISDRSIEGTFISAWILYGCCLLCGYQRRKKPSAFNLIPIGYRKRVLWAYLANVVFYIITIICWITFGILIILFISIVTFLASGEWILVMEETVNSPVYIGAQGAVFDVLMFLFLFGAGMLLSYISDRVIRMIATIGFPLLFEIFALIILHYSGNYGSLIPMGNVIENFGNLPCPIAWLVGFGAITVLTWVGSIYFALKYEKPKEY